MNDGVGALLLQADAAPGMGPDFFFMLGSIFLIFYLLVIRPENRRRKEHEEQVKSAGKGDQVVTSGGIQGLVTGATDDVVTLEIATLKNGERVRVKIARTAISNVTRAGEKTEKSDKSEGSKS